jgi:hypothetical protein
MVFRKYVGQSNRDILSAIFLLFLLGRFVWFVWSNLKHVRNQLDDMYGRIEALHQSIKVTVFFPHVFERPVDELR